MAEAVLWTRDVLAQWRRWVRAHLGMTILLSALAFGFGWIWNTYVMAVFLDGSQPGPDDDRTIATAEGRPLNSLFWLLFFSLLSGFITYAWQRGWRNVWGDLAVLPRKLGQAMAHNRKGALALLLWGISVSLIISTVISSAVSLALGLVLLTLAATPIGTIINFAVVRLWKALAGIATPAAGMGAVLLAGPFLLMLGEALGLLLDWVFASLIVGLILGIAAAVGSILLARGLSGTAAAVLFGLVAVSGVLAGRRAWADDGGWHECSCSEDGLAGIFAWFGSDGAGSVVLNGAVGGAFAGVGTAIGVGMGSVAASLAVAAAQAAATGGRSGAATEGGPSTTQTASRQAAASHETAWQGGQAMPDQAMPDQAAPDQAGPHQAGPHQAGPHQAGAGWAAADMPTVPQQPPAPPVEGMAPVDDFLPEPPDRKRDKRDGDEPQ